MNFSLDQIKTFLQMLSLSLGDFAEISLCDREKYIYIENAINNNKAVGDPIGDNEKYFLEDDNISKLPFIANYKSLLSNMTKLRTSTYFIKDEKKQIEYMISITVNVDQLILLRNILENFINGSLFEKENNANKINQVPKLNLTLPTIIDNVINEGELKYNTTVERMTMKEKQSLIREMFSRGVFLIKGAVPQVSAKLGNSEATIYRYLKVLEKKSK